ncbi:MAG: hypothetical protein WDZ45_01320 [Flavobacteriaceae bacterium]
MNRALILVLILMSACKQQDRKPVLEFDQAMHYNIQIEDQVLFEIASQGTLTNKEQLKIDVLVNKKPQNISDTLFIKDLMEIGFTKNTVAIDKLSELRSVFSNPNEQKTEMNECVKIYRDILVFKTNNQITGMAKVCFECRDVQMVNLNPNSIKSLSDYDYNRLSELLVFVN